MDSTGCHKHLEYSRISFNCLIINAVKCSHDTTITVCNTDFGKIIRQRYCGQFPSHVYKQINDLLDSIIVNLLYTSSSLVNVF